MHLMVDDLLLLARFDAGRALEIDPRRADAHHNLVLALASQGKFDEALRDVLEALKIRPDSAQAQNDLILLPKLREQWHSRH